MALTRTSRMTSLGVVIAVGLSCTIGAVGASAAVAAPAAPSATGAAATAAVIDPSVDAPVVRTIDTEANGTQRMQGMAGTDRVEVLDGDVVVSVWPGGGGLFMIAVGEQFRDTELTIAAVRMVDGEPHRSVPVVLPRTLQVDGLTSSSTTFTPGTHEFRGTATAGATITATDAEGEELFSTEVPSTRAASGPWSAEADLTDAEHTVTFTQTAPSGITTRMQDIAYVPSEVAAPTIDNLDRSVSGEYIIRGTSNGARTGTAVATVGTDEYTVQFRNGLFSVVVPESRIGQTAQVVTRTDAGESAAVPVVLAAAEQDDAIPAPTVRDIVNTPDGRILVNGQRSAPGHIWFLHGDRVVAGTVPDGIFSFFIGKQYTGEQIDMVTMQEGRISDRVALPRLLSVDGVTSEANVFVPGEHAFSGTAQAGSTVVASDADGNRLFEATADGSRSGLGTWSASADLPDSDLAVTFTQTTPDGRTSSMPDVAFTTEDDAAPVSPVTVTGPEEGSTVTTKRPVFTGTGAVGAEVIVRGSVRQVAKTTVQEDGTWSVPADFDLGNGDYRLLAVQTPAGGVTTAADIVFTVRYAVAPVTPVTVTGPEEGSTVTTKRPVFTGTGAVGAEVIVRGSVRQVAKTTVQEDGTWSVPADFDLGNGDYRLLAVQTPAGGGVTTAADIVFTVRHAVAPVAPFAVTGPTEGSTVTSKRPVFTGTGAEGALIVVKGTSRQVASAVVEDGTWSVPADFDLGNSTYRLTVVQTPTGGGASAEKTVNFTVRAR